MKVVLEINGEEVESVDLEKHSRVQVSEASAYLKEKYRERRMDNDWAIFEIVESKVAGQIKKMEVLQQRRSYYDRKYFNDHIPDAPKTPIDRTGFDKYSNKQAS